MHTRRYSAFISYRHADNTQEGRRWAEWLHRALERYVVPPDLIGTPNLRGDPIRDSLYPIFRDEDELPANADLATGIRAALEVSNHLIVLCSPRSAVSPWVRKEVREFKELGRSDCILAIIIAGEPNADDPAKAREGIMPDEECFCEELRFGALRDDGTLDWTLRTEPLAADLRPIGTRAEGFVTAEAYREHLTLHSSLLPEKIATRTDAYRQQLDHALIKVVAGLLGVPLGQLKDRDAAHRTAMAEAEASKQRAIAERERQLAEQAQHSAEEAHLARQITERTARRLAIAGAGALVLALLAGWLWWRTELAQLEEKRQRMLSEDRGRKLETSQKVQKKLLHEGSMADYAVAVQRIEKEKKWQEGVAHLTRSLKWEPENPLAAIRLYSTLTIHAAEKQTWPRQILTHKSRVNSVQFSADGTRIVTASHDNTARVWEVASGKPLGEPLRHESFVISAQFSADGTRIVTASLDATARVWDAASGKPLGEPMRHEESVSSAQFSADGTRIVTVSHDNAARVWDAASGKPLGEPLRHEESVISAQFSPDGTRIVTASFDNTARVWDAASGKPLGEPLRHESFVMSGQFSPDGTRIITASFDNTARVWDAASGKPLGEPLRHEESVISAQFSPDGTRIVTASDDNTARAWDTASGSPLGEPLRHEKSVRSAQFSPDGTRIITASDDNTARVWDAASGKPLGEPLHHENSVISAQFSPDGTRIVTASLDNTSRVWDAASGSPLGEPLRHQDSVISAQFSPDGTRIVTVSHDNTARVWDAASSKPLGEPLRHERFVISAQFSPDGTRIVTASHDDTARVWDAASGKPQGEPLRHEESVRSAQFSPDGKRIITASFDNTARVWDAASGRPLGEPLRHEESVHSAQFSPDGTRIVTASHDNTARVWDAASSKPLGQPLPHKDSVRSAQFSPDGTRIITTSDDNIVRVWDAASSKLLGEPLRHEDSVSSAQFSADGKRILTASFDNTARVWDAASGKPLGEPLRHEDCLTSAQFNSDGTLIMTASFDNTARVWDAASGRPLGEPLRHEDIVRSAQFSADGKRIVTASDDYTAQIWDAEQLSHPHIPVPPWVLDKANALAGLRFTEDGNLQLISGGERFAILSEVVPSNDSWATMVRWLVLPAEKRTLTPYSHFTRRQFAERERDTLMRKGLESALRYDPSVPLARLMLAVFEANPQRATFLRKYDLKHLPADATLWARASMSLTEQKEPKLALQVAQRAISIDANLPAAVRSLAKALSANDQKEAGLAAFEKLLAGEHAEAADFIDAGCLAAELNLIERTKTIFQKAESRFPNDESVARNAGWTFCSLDDAPAAILAFQRARSLLNAQGKPSTDILFALALAQWLNQQQDDATTTYKQLIETDRSQKEAKGWADAKNIAALSAALDLSKAESKVLEALRAATIIKHPNLTTPSKPPEEEEETKK